MIFTQIVIIGLLLLIGLNFMKRRASSQTKAYKKLLLIICLPVAILIVIFPDVSTDIAKVFGIGRGADLLLYGLLLVTIFQIFNNYVKDIEEQRKIVTLARRLAILEAKDGRPKNQKRS